MITEDYDGSCIIVWPKQHSKQQVLSTWEMRVIDARTGEDMLGITGLSICLGGRSWENTAITAQITALADADGAILPTGKPLPVVWEDPEADELKPKMGEYLYLVTEMRIEGITE